MREKAILGKDEVPGSNPGNSSKNPESFCFRGFFLKNTRFCDKTENTESLIEVLLMKQTKLFIICVLVLSLCLNFAACGEDDPDVAGNDWEDPAGSTGSDWEDPGKSEWEDPANTTNSGSDWEDPGKTDWGDLGKTDWEDPAQRSQPDENGMYRHEIDGVVFYTEHDLEQWIDRSADDPHFNLEQMAIDLFGEGVQEARGSAFVPVLDQNGAFVRWRFALEFGNVNLTTGESSSQAKDGFYPYIGIGSTFVYDTGAGAGDEYYKPYYYLNDYSRDCTDYEMLEIALYAFEKWAKDETYLFENFVNVKPDQRIMVVNH